MAVSNRTDFEGVKDQKHNQNALPYCVEEPTSEFEIVEENVVHTYFVEVRVAKESLLIVFPIKDREPNDRKGCQRQVVELEENVVVNEGA